MKTLIINGSPRKKGDTAVLMDTAKKNLHSEVVCIDTYYTAIKPCNDCRHCWNHACCAIDDEMQTVYRQIDDADLIIIASPLYFSELSGSLLSFASRLQYLYVSKHIRKEKALTDKKRHGIVLLAGGGDGSIEPAISTAKCLLGHMNAEFVDYVCSHYTNVTPAREDGAALDKIEKIIFDIVKEIVK